MRRVLFLIAFFLPPPAFAEDKWQLFAPDGFEFTVEMPDKPEQQVEQVPLDGGAMARQEAYLLRRPETGYEQYDFTKVEYPPGSIGRSDEAIKQALDGSQAGGVEPVDGTVDSEKTITLHGRMTREFTATVMKTVTMRTRLVIVGDTLYLMTLLTPKDRASGPDAERYFASFSPKKVPDKK